MFLFVAQGVDGIDCAQFECRQQCADDDADYYEGIDYKRDNGEMFPEAADPVVYDVDTAVVGKTDVKAFFKRILQIEQIADDKGRACQNDALAYEHSDNV